MEQIHLVVRHPQGLHARPAAQFVQTANKFHSAITVANATARGAAANGKSILGVLTLGVSQGIEIDVTADGPDATEAIEALKALVESNFGEPERRT